MTTTKDHKHILDNNGIQAVEYDDVESVVRVFVAKKKPENELDTDEIVANAISHPKTDVIEIGEISAEIDDPPEEKETREKESESDESSTNTPKANANEKDGENEDEQHSEAEPNTKQRKSDDGPVRELLEAESDRHERHRPVPAGVSEINAKSTAATAGPLARVRIDRTANGRWESPETASGSTSTPATNTKTETESETETQTKTQFAPRSSAQNTTQQKPHFVRVSNNHVYARTGDADLGEPITQPSPYDGGTIEADTVGVLAGYVRLENGCRVDAAARTVKIENEQHTAHDLGTIWGRDVYHGPHSALRGALITKTGRTTGVTEGRIAATNASVRVSYGSETITLDEQIIANNMSNGGDSGSPVYIISGGTNDTVRGTLCGLLFAGSDKATIINHIGAIEHDLGVEFTLEHWPPTGTVDPPDNDTNTDTDTGGDTETGNGNSPGDGSSGSGDTSPDGSTGEPDTDTNEDKNEDGKENGDGDEDETENGDGTEDDDGNRNGSDTGDETGTEDDTDTDTDEHAPPLIGSGTYTNRTAPYPFGKIAIGEHTKWEITERAYQDAVQNWLESVFDIVHREYFFDAYRYADFVVGSMPDDPDTPFDESLWYAIEVENSADSAVEGIGQAAMYAGLWQIETGHQNVTPLVILPETHIEQPELEAMKRFATIAVFPTKYDEP